MSKKTSKNMYSQRTENIGLIEGCPFGCVYCKFRVLHNRFALKKEDVNYTPHIHEERFKKRPKATTGDQFVTIGLNGDISRASDEVMLRIIQYCKDWKDRTFLLQSKNPERFMAFEFPDNVILGTTIETNRGQIWNPATAPRFIDLMNYSDISKAPEPYERYFFMSKLTKNRKYVTMEPILDFDVNVMVYQMRSIKPTIVYIGYNTANINLPEPTLAKTQELITKLRELGITVKEKKMRPAWYESSPDEKEHLKALRESHTET